MSLPDTPTAATDTGVIHNIGYRGYQGPRLGRSYATRSLFTQGLRGAFGLGRSGKSKVLPMLMLGLVTLPAAAVVAITILSQGTELRTDYAQYLSGVGQLFIQIFVASQAPVLLSRDLRNHTVPLYFSRPITRGDYVRAKCAAMFAAVLVVTLLPMLVLYLGAILGGLDFGHNTAHFAYGLLAAVLYSAVFSAVGLVIAAATPRRGFGVAAIMGTLVITQIIANIVSGLQSHTTDSSGPSAWAYLISPSGLVDRFVNQVCGLSATDSSALPGSALPGTPGTAGTLVFGLEIVLLVAGAVLLLLRRYRKI